MIQIYLDINFGQLRIDVEGKSYFSASVQNLIPVVYAVEKDSQILGTYGTMYDALLSLRWNKEVSDPTSNMELVVYNRHRDIISSYECGELQKMVEIVERMYKVPDPPKGREYDIEIEVREE